MNALKPWHIIVLVVVILLLFGARRLPDLAKSVGQSLKIFKSEVEDLRGDDKKADVPPATHPAGAPAAGAQPPVTPAAPAPAPPTPEPSSGSSLPPGMWDPNSTRAPGRTDENPKA
ncbi:Sec-independent protein translocase subunit TatA [Cellulomonas sp. PhB143]|uniref:Sec-independent protein translocase subunit TatA n=1 Tax=Cellulomonas sp. PhB143 TaxID=2485186 RepID=UPI000F4696C0|nr:Sec-independent protein translocase subunit TatA [Cellulomonas sp. PhB143]ROS74480.1 sec-independent protein translocase protein TatA [Cellulomonas sp. PhB143]